MRVGRSSDDRMLKRALGASDSLSGPSVRTIRTKGAGAGDRVLVLQCSRVRDVHNADLLPRNSNARALRKKGGKVRLRGPLDRHLPHWSVCLRGRAETLDLLEGDRSLQEGLELASEGREGDTVHVYERGELVPKTPRHVANPRNNELLALALEDTRADLVHNVRRVHRPHESRRSRGLQKPLVEAILHAVHCQSSGEEGSRNGVNV